MNRLESAAHAEDWEFLPKKPEYLFTKPETEKRVLKDIELFNIYSPCIRRA